MKNPVSIFNDVLGPVMIGPSSSHTAASVRIAALIRDLLGGSVKSALFSFPNNSALAHTYRSQGADIGLAGGLLGLSPADRRMAQALTLAREQGLDIEFRVADIPARHPNTYHVLACGNDGREIEAIFLSVGGGMIELCDLNGVPLSLDGGYYETLLLTGQADIAGPAQAAAEAAGLDFLAHHGENEQDDCYIFELRGRRFLTPEEKAQFPGAAILEAAPVLPVLSFSSYEELWQNAARMTQGVDAEKTQLWELAAQYESRRAHCGTEQVIERMRGLVRIWRETLDEMMDGPVEYADRILGSQAHLLAGSQPSGNTAMSAVIRHITLMMEAKSSMRTVIAAPTAGSCGVLPGTVFGLAETVAADEEAIVRAMLAAGMIGVLIAGRATFAGEEGGCQAECGSASGMAAAAAVQLLGGSAAQALDAASMALQNVLGLACDPVANRVEAPCLGKNIMCGCNALAMAELALAGFDPVIPLDETIDAMAEVGRLLPDAICCTGLAGLSVQPSSRRILEKLEQGRS